MKYTIRDRETGNPIEDFDTFEEAEIKLEEYLAKRKEYGDDWGYVKKQAQYLDLMDRLEKGPIVGGKTKQDVELAASELKAFLGDERFSKIQEGAQYINDFGVRELQDALDSGRINIDQFNKFRAEHPNYTPHEVLDYLDMDKPPQGTGKSFNVADSGFKKATGSERAIDDIDNAMLGINNVVSDEALVAKTKALYYESLHNIQQAEHNELVKKDLVSHVTDMRNQALQEIKDTNREKVKADIKSKFDDGSLTIEYLEQQMALPINTSDAETINYINSQIQKLKDDEAIDTTLTEAPAIVDNTAEEIEKQRIEAERVAEVERKRIADEAEAKRIKDEEDAAKAALPTNEAEPIIDIPVASAEDLATMNSAEPVTPLPVKENEAVVSTPQAKSTSTIVRELGISITPAVEFLDNLANNSTMIPNSASVN